MVNIFQIKSVCDDLDGNCSACPFGTKEGCPFLSNDPLDWDTEYINKRFVNSPFNKEEKQNDQPTQQGSEALREISAITIDLECHLWEQFTKEMYLELRNRLRKLLPC